MTLPYDPERSDAQPWPPEDGPSELIQRLRALRWPEATPEVRQRCWEQLSQQVAGLGGPDRGPQAVDDGGGADARERPCRARHEGSDGLHERRFGRHDFATRAGQGRYEGALGHRLAVARRAAVPRAR